MWSEKYHKWQIECHKIIKLRKQKRLLAVTALIAYLKNKNENKVRQNKRYWVHPLWKLREEHGFYHVIFPVVCLEESRMKNYFRMTHTQFENLLCKVGEMLSKQKLTREPIPSAERLALTLRFVSFIKLELILMNN